MAKLLIIPAFDLNEDSNWGSDATNPLWIGFQHLIHVSAIQHGQLY